MTADPVKTIGAERLRFKAGFLLPDPLIPADAGIQFFGHQSHREAFGASSGRVRLSLDPGVRRGERELPQLFRSSGSTPAARQAAV